MSGPIVSPASLWLRLETNIFCSYVTWFMLTRRLINLDTLILLDIFHYLRYYMCLIQWKMSSEIMIQSANHCHKPLEKHVWTCQECILVIAFCSWNSAWSLDEYVSDMS